MKLVKGRYLAPEYSRWLRDAVVGGLFAGLLFILAEMIGNALLGGSGGFFGPLRMFGAIFLGPEALRPDFPLLDAAAAGLIITALLSIGYAMFLTVILATVAGMEKEFVTFCAMLLGLAVWILNFYILAPNFGWLWFEKLNPMLQLAATVIFYGGGLALILDTDIAHHPTEDSFLESAVTEQAPQPR